MEKTKDCFKCGESKPLSAFYKHNQMADGHVNKCKQCNKIDVTENRKSKIEQYREYDRARGSRQPPEYQKQYRAKFPNKYKAHGIVNRAIRAKKLHREPCMVCGTDENIVAHHKDYAKPLNVDWMCQAHHVEWHQNNGEGLNGL